MTSAPARLIDNKDSSTAFFSSSMPAAAAALIMEYSPDTCSNPTQPKMRYLKFLLGTWIMSKLLTYKTTVVFKFLHEFYMVDIFTQWTSSYPCYSYSPKCFWGHNGPSLRLHWSLSTYCIDILHSNINFCITSSFPVKFKILSRQSWSL